jgi:hypothetical protein
MAPVPPVELDLDHHRAVNDRISEALARNTARWAFTRRPRRPRMTPTTALELAALAALAVACSPCAIALAKSLAAA